MPRPARRARPRRRRTRPSRRRSAAVSCRPTRTRTRRGTGRASRRARGGRRRGSRRRRARRGSRARAPGWARPSRQQARATRAGSPRLQGRRAPMSSSRRPGRARRRGRATQRGEDDGANDHDLDGDRNPFASTARLRRTGYDRTSSSRPASSSPAKPVRPTRSRARARRAEHEREELGVEIAGTAGDASRADPEQLLEGFRIALHQVVELLRALDRGKDRGDQQHVRGYAERPGDERPAAVEQPRRRISGGVVGLPVQLEEDLLEIGRLGDEVDHAVAAQP